MDKVTKTLLDFGLNKNEIKVYQQILREKETNPYALAKVTKIPRTTVYEILTSLSFKKLVELKKSDGFTKQQTRIYAKDPSYLRTIINERKKDLVQMDSEIVHILPILKKDYLPSTPNADYQFFPGIEGAKNVFTQACLDDIDLPEYVFNYKIADDVFGREVINKIADFENSRKRKHIPKEIIPLTDWTKHCMAYQYKRDHRFIEVTNIRYIEQPSFNFANKITIKGNRIWIVSVQGEECWGIIIRSKTFSQTLTSVFNALWSLGTTVTKNIMEQWGENEFLVEKKVKKK